MRPSRGYLSIEGTTKLKKHTKVSNKDSAYDGATTTPQSVVDALQYPLGGAAQVLRRVVRNVRAAGSPHRSVRDPFIPTYEQFYLLEITRFR